MLGFNFINGEWTKDKDPAATRNVGIDWTAWLPVGDSILSAVWTINDNSVTPLAKGAPSIVGNITYCPISGGTLNTAPMPSARCTITTLKGAEIQPITLYFKMVTQ